VLKKECQLIGGRILGPRGDEVKGEWRRLHNEELHDLYSSPNIIRAMKSIILKTAGHVARMADRRVAHVALVGRPDERRHRLEDLSVDGIILKWI
jgi:alkanesulfonate monooxygenase SsuD/methylene tetrahydromethanopterin reductase-like flavin-dependent oxidoreductase (luciferase family)